MNVILVKASGLAPWNGKPIGRTELKEYLRLYSTMRDMPSPGILLRHEAGARCSDLAEIRELMRRYLQCSSGKCAEGAEWDWVPAKGINGFDGGG